MKVLLINVIGVLLCILTVYFYFGAVEPCEILKREMKAGMLRDIVKDDVLVRGFASGMVDELVEPFVDSLSPWECTRGVVRIMGGDRPFLPGEVTGR